MSDEKPTLSDITQRYIRDRDAGAWCRSQEARSFMELLEKNAARERERILSEVPTVVSAPNTWTVGGYAPEDTVTLTGRGEATLSVSAPGGRLDTLQIGMEPEIPVTDEMIRAGMNSDWGIENIYRAMAAFAPKTLDSRSLGKTSLINDLLAEAQVRIHDKDREITALRAERDLWKGVHGDLIAKFSAAVPDPKPAPGHNPFREFGGDRRRGGG